MTLKGVSAKMQIAKLYCERFGRLSTKDENSSEG
jgi:hypothetical protein